MSKEISIEDEVKKLSVAGAPREQIVSELVKKTGLKPAEVDQLCLAMEDYFRRRASCDAIVEKGKAIAQLDMLFLACVRIQDFKAALSVRKELNDLLELKSKQPSAKPAQLERFWNG